MQSSWNEDLSSKVINCAKDFLVNGYGLIENFLDEQEILALKKESVKILEDAQDDEIHLFLKTDLSDDLISSGDKIKVFYEKNAFDEQGCFRVAKEASYAKIGHALHSLNDVFRRITGSDKVKAAFAAIGFEKPQVVQSMVNFKNPQVGGEYPAHQDASFLLTEPIVSLAGAWIALDDATVENGCLEFIPRSHEYPVQRRFVRNKSRQNNSEPSMVWEGPDVRYDESKFVKVPVKRGGLVLLGGSVVHRSLENCSSKPRWAYAFHVIDTAKGSWSEENWLQQVDNQSFLPLNDINPTNSS